jgi:hypothetical protein
LEKFSTLPTGSTAKPPFEEKFLTGKKEVFWCVSLNVDPNMKILCKS